MSGKKNYLFHTICYYLSWLACIKLVAIDQALYGIIIVALFSSLQVYWQYKVMHDTKGLMRLILILTMAGFIIDSLFIHAGLLVLTANPFAPDYTAPWMLALWISFAIFIFSTLRGFFSRYVLLGVLSSIGFPFAYALGAMLGAASFPSGNSALVLIGITWGLCIPLCLRLSSSA